MQNFWLQHIVFIQENRWAQQESSPGMTVQKEPPYTHTVHETEFRYHSDLIFEVFVEEAQS